MEPDIDYDLWELLLRQRDSSSERMERHHWLFDGQRGSKDFLL